jgi:hypothetical protein
MKAEHCQADKILDLTSHLVPGQRSLATDTEVAELQAPE